MRSLKVYRMNTLYLNHSRLVDAVSTQFYRYLYEKINWDNRLIAIVGARGTGKTTMLLQYIKNNFPNGNKALYVSLDNIWFQRHSLTDLVQQFHAYGGTHIFLDEVHRYNQWAVEVKNLYDSYPDLHIVFTGSSMLEIHKAHADLSRRMRLYELHGLSFREFLLLEYQLFIESVSLEDIVNRHTEISAEIASKTKVLPLYKEYLKIGYYPFYKEDKEGYHERLRQTVNVILENDLPAIEAIEYSTITKIKKLLMMLASRVPFTPNIAELAAKLETTRTSILKYLNHLEKAELVLLLMTASKGMGIMNKPDKIYLNNPNLLFTLDADNVNEGNLRETFFANQMRTKHHVEIPTKSGDFLIESKYTFEVGGLNKSNRQIKTIPDSFVAMDNIETGFLNKIPLWLFGMTY